MIDQSVFRAVSPGEESHKIASDGRAQIKWGYIFDSGHRQAVAYRSFRVDSFRVDSKVGDYLYDLQRTSSISLSLTTCCMHFSGRWTPMGIWLPNKTGVSRQSGTTSLYTSCQL